MLKNCIDAVTSIRALLQSEQDVEAVSKADRLLKNLKNMRASKIKSSDFQNICNQIKPEIKTLKLFIKKNVKTQYEIEFFDEKPVSGLIIINPDNPSGNYMCRDDIGKLILWAEKKDIFLIDDESFADFADVPLRATLLQQDELEKNQMLL